MMKKYIMVTMLTILTVLLVACKATVNPEKDELYQYVSHDTPLIYEKHNLAIGGYNEFMEHATGDSEALLEALDNDIINALQEVLSATDSLEYKEQTTIELREKYKDVVELEAQALADIAEAIRNEDETALALANEKVKESQKAMDAYNTAVKLKCAELGIVLED